MPDRIEKAFIAGTPREQAKSGRKLRMLLPNFVTLSGLAAGLLSIQMAILERWEHAVLLITFAAFIDTLDGALARMLRATSKFGAELDSLSDFLCFGVAPSVIMYLWVLDGAGPIGWMASLVFAMACALRLARFNTMTEEDPRPEWARGFFMGVPAPAGAGLILMPMIIYFLVPQFGEWRAATPLVGVWTIFIAGLMVSKVPTLSSKQIKVPAISGVLILAIAGSLLAALVHMPWLTLTCLGLLYISSLVFGLYYYDRLSKKHTTTESHV